MTEYLLEKVHINFDNDFVFLARGKQLFHVSYNQWLKQEGNNAPNQVRGKIFRGPGRTPLFVNFFRLGLRKVF